MAILYTNASGQYCSVPNEADYDLTTAISLTGWFRTTSTWLSIWEVIIAKGDSAWRFSRYSGDGNRGLHWATSGTTGAFLNWDGVADDSAWHFFGATFQSGSPGSKYIFLDGAYVATDTNVTGTINNSAHDVYLGENQQTTGRLFNGTQHDMRIYNRQLSFAELTAIWACRGGDTVRNGLISRWIGDQGAPGGVVASVQDAGTLGNTATPVNSPVYAGSVSGHRRRRAA